MLFLTLTIIHLTCSKFGLYIKNRSNRQIIKKTKTKHTMTIELLFIIVEGIKTNTVELA